MLNDLFLGLSLLGAQWVLYLLVILSVISVALMFERALFFRSATTGLGVFRAQIRESAAQGRWDDARKAALERLKVSTGDLETGVASALLQAAAGTSPDVLTELAQDAVLRAKIKWEKNLAMLATIGSNAPFIGLFGTVLGIIKAFHDLSQTNTGVQTISSGISEALVATAIGILVAIPAVVAFNLFQRRVKTALTEAEALKSFLIGQLSAGKGSR